MGFGAQILWGWKRLNLPDHSESKSTAVTILEMDAFWTLGRRSKRFTKKTKLPDQLEEDLIRKKQTSSGQNCLILGVSLDYR